MPEPASESAGAIRSIAEFLIIPVTTIAGGAWAWIGKVSHRLTKLETTTEAHEKRFESFASENREQHAETKYALGEIHANIRQLNDGMERLLEASEGDRA